MKSTRIILIIILLSCSGILRAGLVGQWDFENNYLDSSGNNNNGTAMGSGNSFVFDVERNGRVLSLNGSGLVEIANATNFNLGSNFTVIAWVKADAIGVPTWAPVVQKYQTFKLTRASSQLNMGAYVDNHATSVPQYNVWNNEWHMLAMTYNGSKLTSYIDDITSQANNATVPGNATANINALRIGGVSLAGVKITGFIDDVKIYNTCLTSNEVLAHIPEPATMLLLSSGSGLLFLKRKRS